MPAFYGGRAGQPSGWPVSYVTGSPTLHVRHPCRNGLGDAFRRANERGHIMFDSTSGNDTQAAGGNRWDYVTCRDHVRACDVLDKRLRQAAGLSALLYGEGMETFSGLNDTIRDDILWLLHDTICDAMAARAAERKVARS